MKVVTRRTQRVAQFLAEARILQRTINRLRNCGLVKKGVYRFTTFAEADQWMTQQIASSHAHQKLKTS